MEFEIDEHTLEILTKCICAKADEREYKEAYDWIHLKEENKTYFNSLYSAWFATRLTRKIDSDLELQVWNKLNLQKDKLQTDSGTINRVKWINQFRRVAALLVIVFSLGFFLYSYFGSNNKTSDLYTVEAPKGAKSSITLADGTHVWLNAGSKIQYFVIYNQKTRDIYLTGEAYFEVAKNKSKPFRVHAGGIVVNALGTTFNVKAYPEEKVVETTLVEGLVSIENEKTNNSKDKTLFILKPKQQAVYYKTRAEIVLTDTSANSLLAHSPKEQKLLPIAPGKIVLTPGIETEVYTSWKDKRWVFQKETLENIAVRLERLYDVHVIFRDDELKEFNLSGAFQEETLEQVLDAIRLTIPIDYTIKHQEVIISMDSKLKNKYQKLLINN